MVRRDYHDLETISDILTAGIAITAFSLLLFALTMNLRDKVVRSFCLILVSVVIVFSAEAFSSTAVEPWQVAFWLRLQWVGIILLPALIFFVFRRGSGNYRSAQPLAAQVGFPGCLCRYGVFPVHAPGWVVHGSGDLD